MLVIENLPDKDLLERYVKGNEKCLEVLIYRHKNAIFGYIMNVVGLDRALAEDIYQEAFFKVINSLKKGKYVHDGRFVPWVRRIAYNLAMDHYREAKKIKTYSVVKTKNGEEVDIFSRLRLPEESHEQKKVKKQLNEEIKGLFVELPEEQREVLMLRLYYDMSFGEISEVTKTTLNTCLGRMRYALINLNKLIKERNIELMV